MSSGPLDAVGEVPLVGDKVAFGAANKGAHPLLVGTIIAVRPKTVLIAYEHRDRYTREYVKTTASRESAAFVILEKRYHDRKNR